MENLETQNDLENIEEYVNQQLKAMENDSDEEKEENQYILFKLDEQDYGLEIEHVHEINRLKEVRINPVPKAPQYVEGIINLRGEVVPVIDLKKKIGLTPKETGRETRILIVKMENKTIGLLVDAVQKVIHIDSNNMIETPEEIKDINMKFFSGIVKNGTKTILLLNINEVLNSEED